MHSCENCLSNTGLPQIECQSSLHLWPHQKHQRCSIQLKDLMKVTALKTFVLRSPKQCNLGSITRTDQRSLFAETLRRVLYVSHCRLAREPKNRDFATVASFPMHMRGFSGVNVTFWGRCFLEGKSLTAWPHLQPHLQPPLPSPPEVYTGWTYHAFLYVITDVPW